MKILVIKPSSFGDIVQTLQAVEGLVDKCKCDGINIEIHWVVRECFSSLINQVPFVDKVFVFYRKKGILGFIKLVHEIRKFNYDFVLDFQGLLRSGLMTLFAKSKNKFGREDSREGAGLFYTKTFAPHKDKIHAIYKYQALAESICDNIAPKRPLSIVSPQNTLNIPHKYVAIFPFSRVKNKEWHHFDELTNMILEKTDFTCVLLGQKDYHEHANNQRVVNLINKTSVSDLTQIIQNASCIIANDSGPLHLAAALKKPLIGIYGPTNASLYGPFPTTDLNHKVFQSDSSLDDINVANVFNAILSLTV